MLAAQLEKERTEKAAQLELERTEKAAQLEQEKVAKAAQLEREKTEKAEANSELEIQAPIRRRLKDPDSAKFGKLVQIDSTMACIPVNARNSYGGYTGEKFIALKKSGSDVWVINDDISGGEFADSLCRLRMLTMK